MPTNVRPFTGAKGNRPTGPVLLNRQSPRARGLVAWWPLNGQTWDYAGAKAGTPISAAYAGLPAHGGFAFSNAGSSAVDGGNATILQFTGSQPFTLASWCIIPNLAATAFQYLVGKGYDGTNEGYYLRGDSTNGLSFGAYNGVVSQTTYNPGGAWSGTTPNRVAGVYDGTFWRLYLNGLPVGTPQGSGGPYATTKDVYLSAADISGAVSRNLIGKQWDTCIWNRVLSPLEMLQDYDPATRWDLYAVPSSRVFFDVAAAPGGFSPWWAAQSNQVMGGAPC